jgi:hypothetical protein
MEYATTTKQLSELIIANIPMIKRGVKDVKFTSSGLENIVHVVIIN